jgi:hypothetical protein
MAGQIYKIKQELADDENYDCFKAWSRSMEGKYEGTVLEFVFVVPFCHCPGRSRKAGWGCVGKVRASHFRSSVLSL